MAEFMIWVGAIVVVYAYFGYPLCLWMLLRSRPRRGASEGNDLPSLTIIITAFNEGRILRKKIENTLALHYPAQQKPQILIASDASTDDTDNIAESFASQGVELVRLQTRGGKERAQGNAMLRAQGEIIFFTDAKVLLAADAVANAARYFADASIGAVSSCDSISGGEGGEGAYVKYEMWLRSMESDFSSLVGLSGSAFAVRKSVCQNWHVNIPSDFALLLQARRLGLRGVHAPDVQATYEAVPEPGREFERKVRTVLRGITTLAQCKEVLSPSFGSFAWQVASHKLCRWLVPWAFLVTGLGAFAAAPHSELSALIALLWSVLVFLGLSGLLFPEFREKIWVKVPQFFLLSNAAVAVAWIDFFRGKRSVAWTPSDKGNQHG